MSGDLFHAHMRPFGNCRVQAGAQTLRSIAVSSVPAGRVGPPNGPREALHGGGQGRSPAPLLSVRETSPSDGQRTVSGTLARRAPPWPRPPNWGDSSATDSGGRCRRGRPYAPPLLVFESMCCHALTCFVIRWRELASADS